MESVVAQWLGVARTRVTVAGGTSRASRCSASKASPAMLANADGGARRSAFRERSSRETMGASIIDGKAIAATVRPKWPPRWRSVLSPGTAPRPAWPWCWSARTRRARSTCAPRPGRPARWAWRRSSTSCRPTTSEAELLALIGELNRRPDVHGILVQLPLPKHIDTAKVIEAIDPAKDVDGFHPVNAGRLAIGEPRRWRPCTPTGCVILAKSVRPELGGLEAVVIGRSNIVGKPMAQLLLNANCTVTHRAFAHARPAGRGAPRRSCDRRGGPAGDGARRLDQARRHRHRRGHQPRGRVRTARAGWWATWPSRRPSRWPAPSRRCPAASAP